MAGISDEPALPDDTPDESLEARAMMVALQALARAVDKNTGAVLRNLAAHGQQIAHDDPGAAAFAEALAGLGDKTVHAPPRPRPPADDPADQPAPHDPTNPPPPPGPADPARAGEPDEDDGTEAFKRAIDKLDRAAERLKDEAENRKAYEARQRERKKKGQAPLAPYRKDVDYRKKMKPAESMLGRGLRQLRNNLLRRVRSPKQRKAVKAAFRYAGKAVRGGAGAAGAVLGPLVAGLMRLLGPAQALAAVLGSAASGMDLISKGTRLLAAVFAPILLPVTVLIAAALLALSDLLWSELMPALKGWFGFVLQVGVPVMKALFDIVADNIKVLQTAVYWQVEFTNTLIRVVNKLSSLIGAGELPELPNVPKPDWTPPRKTDDAAVLREENERRDRRATEHAAALDAQARAEGKDRLPTDHPDSPWNPRNPGNIAAEAGRRADAERDARLKERGVDPRAARPGGADPKKPDFKKLLGEVVQSLEFSQGPKASITDLGAPRNNAQLAVFGDPFEKRMETMMGQVIGLLKEGVAGLPDQGAKLPPPPLGNKPR